jgi:GT2 family glycosyltransferase
MVSINKNMVVNKSNKMMINTLVIILNHNTADLTSNLFNSLYPYEKNDYETFILDNGSGLQELTNLEELILNKNRIIKINENLLFGGGLNYAFEIIKENKKYNSLLFLNSDLIVHPYKFVPSLYYCLNTFNLDIISPCIIQPTFHQNYWKQMHNWGSPEVRPVKWVDLQSPMFSRSFMENKAFIPNELRFGWGIDILFGVLTNKIGVLDTVPALHLDSQTVKRRGGIDKVIANYWENADKNMHEYFYNHYQNYFYEMREYGKNYSNESEI